IAKQAIPSSDGSDTLRLHLINGEIHETDARTPTQYNIYTFSSTDMAISLPPAAKQSQGAAPLKQWTSKDLLKQINNPDRKYKIEFHRRLALPTACLVLVLIGVPLGLSAKKGGRGAGFVLTIVLVFIYYFLSNIGVVLATNGKLNPVLGVWLANIIFAAT